MPACPPVAFAQTAVNPKYTYLTFAVFAAIIGVTMYITYLAAKRTKTAADFYAAALARAGATTEANP